MTSSGPVTRDLSLVERLLEYNDRLAAESDPSEQTSSAPLLGGGNRHHASTNSGQGPYGTDVQQHDRHGKGQAKPLEPSRRTTENLGDAEPSSHENRSFKAILLLWVFAPLGICLFYLITSCLLMLPFWIIAGFLCVLIRSAESPNLWFYCFILALLLPFNILGTWILSRATGIYALTANNLRDFYGSTSRGNEDV